MRRFPVTMTVYEGVRMARAARVHRYPVHPAKLTEPEPRVNPPAMLAQVEHRAIAQDVESQRRPGLGILRLLRHGVVMTDVLVIVTVLAVVMRSRPRTRKSVGSGLTHP